MSDDVGWREGATEVAASVDVRRELHDSQAAQAMCKELVKQGYMEGRVLPDGSVALLGELLYTRAIYLGATREGWARRFCFEDRDLASARFRSLESEQDEPEGYVATRYG